MSNPSIPTVPPTDPAMYRLLSALRANVLKFGGAVPQDQLKPLATTATQAEIIAAINLIIARLT